MPEKEEYSYDELDEAGKNKALHYIDSYVRGILELNRGPRFTNRSSIECIIADLEPVFYKKGEVKDYFKKYTEVNPELIRDIYEQCNTAR
jgi:hypothetical protein